MKRLLTYVFAMALGFGSVAAEATIYTEDFEATFPAWESGWLGQNSNLKNYYGVGQDRGNNPDGLWLSDGNHSDGIANISFLSPFGSTITDFSIDVTSWLTNATFQAFDMSSTLIYNTNISVLEGAYVDPGTYQHLAFTSSNGVSGFRITGGTVEGNTSIDNVIVTTGGATINNANNVPEPASLALLGLGFAGLRFARRKVA